MVTRMEQFPAIDAPATPGMASCLISGVRLGVDAHTGAGAIAHGRRVDIRLADGRIAAIAPAARRRPTGDTNMLDGRDLIVFPGFVNAHVHSNESFEQGAYDGIALEEWLVLAYPPLAGERAAPRLDYLRAMKIAMQSLRSGVAALHDDFLNPGCDPARLDAVLDGYAATGMRVAVACTFSDLAYLDGLADGRALCPPALRNRLDAIRGPAVREQVRFYEAAVRRLRGRRSDRLSLTLGPRGPQRCSVNLLRLVGEMSAHSAAPVHMHVLETRAQWLAGRRLHGRSLVAVLEEAGLLSVRLTMNHAIWIDAEDIARMGAHGVSTTHNPMSNLKLSSGLAPVKRLLAAGICVALGSDGPATGDSADFLQSLRFAALMHKLDVDNPAEAPGADALLHMATAAGVRSMGGGASAGRLAPGQLADLSFLDARNLAFVPLNHAPRQLVYAAGSDAVAGVMAGGEMLFWEGRFARFDAAAVDAEIREAAARFRRDVLGKRRAANRELRPFLRRVIANARRKTADCPTLNRVALD
jgi:5-methylthioadenosine/S-adenosylhomocysteine deaminase